MLLYAKEILFSTLSCTTATLELNDRAQVAIKIYTICLPIRRKSHWKNFHKKAVKFETITKTKLDCSKYNKTYESYYDANAMLISVSNN
jgi:hypothetical protein